MRGNNEILGHLAAYRTESSAVYPGRRIYPSRPVGDSPRRDYWQEQLAASHGLYGNGRGSGRQQSPQPSQGSQGRYHRAVLIASASALGAAGAAIAIVEGLRH